MNMDYQVAVIGAGIVGASIAARLLQRGLSVVLLEQGSVASRGASASSGGLLRLYDADPLLMQLTAHSLRVMAEAPFSDTYTRALRRSGVLYRADIAHESALEAAIERYASAEYPLRRVQGFGPWSARADRAELYEPHACVGDVRGATARLCQRVRRDGLLIEHCRVEFIDWQADGSAHIQLGEARLDCQTVVLASGAWTHRLLPELALQSRAIPLARVQTEAAWPLPLIDAVSGSYAIPLGPHLVQSGCGLRDRALLPEQLARPDARHIEDARQRVGQLAGGGRVRVLDVVPGFDSYSADGRPLLGFVDEPRGLYVACGLSGVGFKFAPGIADLAARQIQGYLHDGQRSVDPHWAGLDARRGMPS